MGKVTRVWKWSLGLLLQCYESCRKQGGWVCYTNRYSNKGLDWWCHKGTESRVNLLPIVHHMRKWSVFATTLCASSAITAVTFRLLTLEMRKRQSLQPSQYLSLLLPFMILPGMDCFFSEQRNMMLLTNSKNKQFLTLNATKNVFIDQQTMINRCYRSVCSVPGSSCEEVSACVVCFVWIRTTLPITGSGLWFTRFEVSELLPESLSTIVQPVTQSPTLCCASHLDLRSPSVLNLSNTWSPNKQSKAPAGKLPLIASWSRQQTTRKLQCRYFNIDVENTCTRVIEG